MNCSKTKEFIILGFNVVPEFKFLLFIVFLFIYVLTLTTNITIIMLVRFDSQLHSPMYFFITNLSLLEIGYVSSTLPNLMFGLITGNKAIPFIACIAQLCCFSCLGSTELVLLPLMSYDRYLAICNPLRYAMLMSPEKCTKLAAMSWFLGTVVALAAFFMVTISCFCGPNIVEHFLCESAPLLKLSCSDVSTATSVLSNLSTVWILSSVFLTMLSYSFIIYAVVKIPSTSGMKKALSTCTSHFIVVFFFYTSVCVMYVHPSSSNTSRNKISTVFYGIITPLLNPFVYSLRNKDMKNAFMKVLRKSRNMSL
uniref:Olfactory receptor n=1 Tax=Pyxicephalus adspersus TaxID=30357 RepID=A0AAV3A8G5_PYXAD|nr:TPA: hypothetical protein GDO54_013746 [Pyxicephalus adspersus]